ncbi:MAG: type II secretion system GspH family protein [Planctomycetes bacterium]|jgi:prepilin-type N-terminal cleavage/methylation domain-containing protein|nr:type II secretion system GspH family protein [Planctomycetota bacterium]
MNRIPQRTPKPAFTLIELLVVVAILSVLLAVLLPGLHRARLLAARARCTKQLEAIAGGLLKYAEENNNRLSLVGFGANAEFEFGGWRGRGYARYRPVNPHAQPGLDANSPSESEAQLFRCPADGGDTDDPTSLFEFHGNSYQANMALGCSGPLQVIDGPWGAIHSDINRLLKKGVPIIDTPQSAFTLLVGDNNWYRQLDPAWHTCGKSWHDQRHQYNVAFLDRHVERVHIHKGIYYERDAYRWQPFNKDLDDRVLALQKGVPCSCGGE